MKRYVIMAASLSNMGGAQMYLRNKMLYLRRQGWDVTIIAGKASNVLIEELREFNQVFPELLYNKYYYTNRIQKRVTKSLCNIIADKDYEEIVLESTTITVATWTESVAMQVGAKHLVYLLQEHNELTNNGLKEFFIFKHLRRELAGITNKTLSDLFKPFHLIDANTSYQLSASCTNVEEDVDSPFISQVNSGKHDYIIGALSRLDKPFVTHAVNDICHFATQHKDKHFLLLWIGGAPAGTPIRHQIEAVVGKIRNIEIIITGYIYPVPTRLLELCNVFISSAGSCWVCKRSGVPTIPYDGNDFQPIGIVNDIKSFF